MPEIAEHFLSLGSNVGTTVAGVTSTAGSRRSELNSPFAIRVFSNGSMFILDTGNYRVLKWQVGEPLGYVVAGGNGYGSTFDRFGTCYGFFVDSLFNIYVSDSSFHRVTVWRVSNTTSGQLVITCQDISIENIFLVGRWRERRRKHAGQTEFPLGDSCGWQRINVHCRSVQSSSTEMGCR